MMKKGDFIVVADNADDEVRASSSQNHATATMCTEQFFRNQYE
jgi:hypothetical protein